MDAIVKEVSGWLQTLDTIATKTQERKTDPLRTENDPSNKIGNWQINKKVGTGSFGVIYDGIDPKTQKHLAFKFESTACESPQLREEYRCYKLLAGCNSNISRFLEGVSPVHAFGDQYLHRYLVIDRLGPSLEMLYSKCKRVFSVKTVCMLGIQMIDRIKCIHERKLIYRDIKPQNFLMGRPGSDEEDEVFIVDLGMCKEYIDPITKNHISFGGSRALSGTVQFLSNSAIQGFQQSRRDDIESVCLVLIYLLKGLPWNNAGSTDKVTKLKLETTAEDLCEGLAPQFLEYINYIRNLGFEVEPDYAYLQGLLNAVLEDLGTTNDRKFDWGKLPVVGSLRPVFYDDATQKSIHQLHKDIAATRYRVMRAARGTPTAPKFSTRGMSTALSRIPGGPMQQAGQRSMDPPPADQHLSKAQKSLVHLSDKILRDLAWTEDLETSRNALHTALELATVSMSNPTPSEDHTTNPTSPTGVVGGSVSPVQPTSPKTRVWRPPVMSTRPGSKEGRPRTPDDKMNSRSSKGSNSPDRRKSPSQVTQNLPPPPPLPMGKGSAPPEPTQSALIPTMAEYKFKAEALEVDDCDSIEEELAPVVPEYHMRRGGARES
ncbi:hypothetical protein CFO_g4072 [Ceratocystis platani]|uniref:non-specific serine/threonine protein kinase n=1 Tax=Ceratocystis fimbriata f. sp. platani TaxID=88771 RepID=A0A0F8AYX2_CERFI|nr:hypothetical protein CFO_g4072 [Ceratocystis platani]